MAISVAMFHMFQNLNALTYVPQVEKETLENLQYSNDSHVFSCAYIQPLVAFYAGHEGTVAYWDGQVEIAS